MSSLVSFSSRMLLCLVLSMAAFAQSDRGTITGTVLDPASAVVPGAKVVARNADTGVVSETVATETGNYTLASLPAGTYDVSVEASGFKRTTRTGIVVQVAQTARVDVALQVGSATESITITAETPLLRTENAEQSVTITGDKINSLPLNFSGGGAGNNGSIRNWLSFAILSPGVSGTAYNAPINGQPGGNFKIYLEGQDVTSSNDTTWTSIVAAGSVESINEFSMQTSNFAAEFGQVSGAVFNFNTKSGTNQLHGSGFEYLTNEALDAARPFTHVRGIDRKHDFGFSVGGPVRIPKIYNGKNKSFFFFSLEEYRVRLGSSGTLGTVPTAAYRNGDFSGALSGRRWARTG
jgi:Carboxypeptidase regulatory-like domain